MSVWGAHKTEESTMILDLTRCFSAENAIYRFGETETLLLQAIGIVVKTFF